MDHRELIYTLAINYVNDKDNPDCSMREIEGRFRDLIDACRQEIKRLKLWRTCDSCGEDLRGFHKPDCPVIKEVERG